MLDMNLLNKFDLGVFDNLSRYTKTYHLKLKRGRSISIEVDTSEYTHAFKMVFIGKHDDDKYPSFTKLGKYCTQDNGIYIWKNVPNSLVEDFLKEVLEKEGVFHVGYEFIEQV